MKAPALRSTRSPARCQLFHPFLGGSPTKIDYSKKGTLIVASLLEDLVKDTLVNAQLERGATQPRPVLGVRIS